ncbi:hypothetical protein N7455_007045 [Penicillium solitum]|uniref:uncharacterized protein n=1 Tax=Penicillium solitum TaxID=60172 RepID=UPI0032C45699|nr:hypothetical protein N7455_007045 [Penicillium solitum]
MCTTSSLTLLRILDRSVGMVSRTYMYIGMSKFMVICAIDNLAVASSRVSVTATSPRRPGIYCSLARGDNSMFFSGPFSDPVFNVKAALARRNQRSQTSNALVA